LDYTSKHKDGSKQVASPDSLPDPPGYSNSTFPESTSHDSKPDLIEKKSWDIALGPIKQLPMNLFIMWMAGSSISIFPIMMIGMMFIRPIQALLSIQQTFKMIEGKNALIQRFVYTVGNLAGVGLAVYKCQVMGLLPTHASDWLAFVEPQQRMEWGYGGLMF